MGFELGPRQKATDLLFTPGPLLAFAGAVVLAVSLFFFNQAVPSGSDVDAIIEAKSQSGSSLKSMLGMVAGIVMCVAGGLWALMSFTHGRK